MILLVIGVGAGCALNHDVGIMTWQEYAGRSVDWPYILRIGDGRGELLYYGARHTYSPSDAQVVEIERLWGAFRADIAFNEGGNPPVEKSRDSAVEKHGEAGLVRFLAARDDVPVASLDPSRSEEVAYLRQTFSAEDIKLFFVLRAVAQFTGRRGNNAADQEVGRVLPIFNTTPGLMGSPRSLDEVAAAYLHHFPGHGTYRDTPLGWFDPMRSDTLLNRISRISSEYRDRFIVEILTRNVAEGQRVFAVVGGTHVVMQEASLRLRLARRTPRSP